MGLHLLTGADAVSAAARPLVERDPIGNTIVGTALSSLADGAWCALGTGASTGAYAVRTEPMYPPVVSAGWSAADLPDLAAAIADLPDLAGVNGMVPVGARLAELVGRPVRRRLDQRLFRLDELTCPEGVDGSAATAGVECRRLLTDWSVDFHEELGGLGDPIGAVERLLAGAGVAWLWHDGAGTPVSLACARGPVAGSSRIGPVYTPPEHRRHGYAAAVTAAATRSVLEQGAVPVLFTDLANPTSTAIYARLGYRPVSDWTMTLFGPLEPTPH